LTRQEEEKFYKNPENVIADARMAGLLNSDAIEDRRREVLWARNWPASAGVARAPTSSTRGIAVPEVDDV
jgi:hypothetical protein